MPLKITYKSPPYRDKVLEFPDSLEEIRIGRTTGSEVPFPEEMAAVGHDHFAIKREAGAYKFVINPHHRVFLYGKDAYDGQELSAAQEVYLGTTSGPRLLLEPSRAGGANYVATEPQGKSDALPEIARSNARWTHITGAVLGLALLIGVFAYWNLSEQVQPIYSTAGSNTDFSAIIAKFQNSVFLVDEVDSAGSSHGGATAWVVALPNGRKVFATNAHVALMLLDARKKGYKLVVRSPVAPYREYEITDAAVHPAYVAFNNAMVDAEKKANSGLLRQVDVSPAYDVAVLIPAEQDGLPDAIPLAPAKRLDTLHAGEPVAFVGYPAENLVNFDVRAPASTSQVGIITSVRNFFLTSDGGPPQLLEHSLPSAGGASGSPIFDNTGRVIALLSGGNNIASKDGRIPNAALVNFAQRVDLLRDLLEGTADGKLDGYKKQWADGIARWSRPPEAVASVYVKRFEAGQGKLTVASRAGATGAADPLFRNRSAATFDFTFAANTRYLLTAATPAGKPLRLVVLDANNTSTVIDVTVAVADGPLTVIEVPPGEQLSARVAVISESGGEDAPDTTPVPFKLNLYWPAAPTDGSGVGGTTAPHTGGDNPPADGGGADEGQGH